MQTYNIHYAKTQLSRLVEKASAGESFIIAKAGNPMVKVIPIESAKSPQRIGFLTKQLNIPDNFIELDDEVLNLFEITK